MGISSISVSHAQLLPLYSCSLSGWNKGAIIAQACHATAAVLMTYRDDPAVQEYCSPQNLQAMTKIVLKASKEEFEGLRVGLGEAAVEHWAWVEQPDGICSAIALKPVEKTAVEHHFKNLKLYR